MENITPAPRALAALDNPPADTGTFRCTLNAQRRQILFEISHQKRINASIVKAA